MKIKIRINELILEGFDYHDYGRLSTTILDELSILVRKNGLLKLSNKDVASIRISLNPWNKDIKVIGTEVARSIFSTGMKRSQTLNENSDARTSY